MNGIRDVFKLSTSKLSHAHLQYEANELYQQSFALSLILSEHISPNSYVAYLTEQSPFNFLLAELALSHLNTYLLPTSFESIKNELDYYLLNVPINFFLLDSKILSSWLIKKKNCKLIDSFKGVNSNLFLISTPDENSKTLKLEHNSIVLSTSGTSSDKKFIIQSQENFTSSIQTFSSTTIFKDKSKYLNLLPLYFSGGRKVFYSCLLNNIDIEFADYFTVKDDCDLSSGTPYILRKVLESREGPFNLSFVCGGAELSNQLIKAASRKSITVYNVYGLTETSSIGAYSTPEFQKPHSVGMLSSVNQYKILNQELYIKGPTVSRHHMKEKQLLSLLDQEGWIKTNDLVRIDDRGFLFLDGRKSSLIKLSDGLFVSKQELSRIIEEYTDLEYFALSHLKEDCFNLFVSTKHLSQEENLIQVLSKMNQKENFSIVNLKFIEELFEAKQFSKEVVSASGKLVHQIEIEKNEDREVN